MDHHPEFWNAWPDRLVSELVAHCSNQHLPSSFGRAVMKTGFCRLHKLLIYEASSHRPRFRRSSTSCRIRGVGKICPGSSCQLSGEARVRGLACLLHRFEGPRVTACLLRRFEGLRGFPFRGGLACLLWRFQGLLKFLSFAWFLVKDCELSIERPQRTLDLRFDEPRETDAVYAYLIFVICQT